MDTAEGVRICLICGLETADKMQLEAKFVKTEVSIISWVHGQMDMLIYFDFFCSL